MHYIIRRSVTGVVLAVAAALASVPVAHATVAYATKSSPQTITSYGTTGKTYGYWDASKSSTTAIRSYYPSAYYWYNDADDHTIYVKSLSFASQNGHDIASTGGSTNHGNVYGAWTRFSSVPNSTMSISGWSGTIVTRANTYTCLDVPWRTDPCTVSIQKRESLNF